MEPPEVPPRSRATSARPFLFGKERRRHPRVPLRVGVGICCGGSFHVGTTSDISESGLFIEAETLHEVGTELEIEIFLPGGFNIHTRAVVRRVRVPDDEAGVAPGMGLELTGLDPSERAAIAALVEAGGVAPWR